MSNPNPPAALRGLPRLLVQLSLLALAGYALFLGRAATIAAGGSDSSGYLNSARLFAAGRLWDDVRLPPEFGVPIERAHFQPLGYKVSSENPHLAPTYPTGLPLHFALAGKLFGWSAGPWLVGFGGILAALFLCYATAREFGLGHWLAWAGAVVLGSYPVFIFTSIQPLSDTLATAWCLAAFYAALRARRQTGWAAACGAAFALAVLVRPTNLLALPALLVVLGCDWRRLALTVLAGLPGAAWMAYYNHALYGSALRSGYPSLETAFALEYFAPTLAHFGHWLAVMLPAALLVLPFFALLRREGRTRVLLAATLWFLPFVGFYVFYAISHEDWSCLRFLLPGTPGLIIAALLGAEAAAGMIAERRREFFRHVCAAALAAWAIGCGWYWTAHLHVLLIPGYERAYTEGSLKAREVLPPDAIVVCSAFSGSLYYYTGLAILRWDFLGQTEFAHYTALARKSGRPVCAVTFAWEEKDAIRERCTGDWQRLATVRNITLWRLSSPKN